MESIDTNIISNYDNQFKETKNDCDVPTLLIRCQNVIVSNITISKAVSLISFVKQFSLDRLSDAVLECISENFQTAVENGLFHKLPHKDFKFLLNNEKLTVFKHGIPVENYEACILASLGNYLSANNVENEKLVEDLLNAIRFSDIPSDMLESMTNEYTVFHAFKARICTTQRTTTQVSRKYSKSERTLVSYQEYASIPKMYLEKYGFGIVSCFNDSELIEINDRPLTIGVWIVKWEGIDLVGGLHIHYQSGKHLVHGTKPARHDIVNEKEFTLYEEEVVTKINIWHGMFIDSITFFTNMRRKFGPYGGGGGHRTDWDIPPGKHGYFHSFKGKVVKHRYANSVAYLQFNWIAFGKDGYGEILPTGDLFSTERTHGLEEIDRIMDID
ncbi:uncharacterized protein LOC127723890 [Mytilus californianus]|uniref:uncharacterized protein LOC127723890 n=1 Tax=Mytilus californianus TaxID=6549 RepID=UPI0022450345|nr:uncharacterized protein LOC127723890 [Mytilus californianus]XP_052086577.1 uncharacterized protein LOC127723890 [Mytilus californianus]